MQMAVALGSQVEFSEVLPGSLFPHVFVELYGKQLGQCCTVLLLSEPTNRARHYQVVFGYVSKGGFVQLFA